MPDTIPSLQRLWQEPGRKPGRLPSIDSYSIDQKESLQGRQQPYEYDDFSFQPKLGQDNYRLRASNQSGWEQAGLFLGNLIPNIAGTLIEMVGSVGSLVTEFGNDRDYSNWMTEFGQSIKNPFGEIYRMNPTQTWDVHDPAWWYGHAQGLIESATAFAGGGIGLAKIFGGAAKMLGLGKAGQVGAQVATAGTLAYAEGALSGARVYEQTYQLQYDKLTQEGIDPVVAASKAKRIASQSAAATVQLNTMFATVLNMTAIAPLFRTNDDIMRWYHTSGKRQAGERFDDWKERLRATNVADSDIAKLIDTRKNFMYSYLAETGQEGTEELINQWAERRGLERGKQGKEMESLRELLKDTSHFFDDVLNAEGALSFVLGGFGGLSQTVLIDRLPAHKTYQAEDGSLSLNKFDAEVTEDGKYKVKYVTSRHKEKVGNRKFFENTKDAILNDIKRIEEIQADIVKAINKKDFIKADQLKFQLFDTAAISSIQLGQADSFMSQYDDIASIDNSTSLHEVLMPQLNELTEQMKTETDPAVKQQLQAQVQELQKQIDSLTGVTEAMKKGYAKDTKDNEYKRRAQEAKRDIEEYDQLWKDIQKKYNSGEEFHARFADYLFGKEIDVRRKDKILNEYEKIIRKNEAERDALLTPDQDILALRTVNELHADQTVRGNLLKDLNDLNTAVQTSNVEAIKTVAQKYMPNIDSDEDLTKAVKGTIEQLKDRIETIDAEFLDKTQTLELSEGFLKWKEKHSNKSVLDYLKTVYKKDSLDAAIAADLAYWQESKEELRINKLNLAHLRSPKGRREYIRMAKETSNRLAKALRDKIEKDNKAFIEDTTDKHTASDLNQVQRQYFKEQLQKRFQELRSELISLRAVLKRKREELRKISSDGLISRAVNFDIIKALKKEIALAERYIKQSQEEIDIIKQRLQALEENPDMSVKEIKDHLPWDKEESKDPEITDELTPLMNTIAKHTSNEMQAAGVLEALNEYEKEIRAGVTKFTLNFLDQEGFVGKGKLTRGQAATIMQAFAIQLGEALQQENEETKETEEEVDEVQRQIDEVNRKRQEDLAALKKGSKGVVAKRKEINDAANAVIDRLLNPEKVGEEAEIIITDLEEDIDVIEPLATEIEQAMYHEGAKVEQAAAKVNTLTHEYDQDIKEGAYTKEDRFQLNELVNPLYLKHGKIKQGSKIKLVVDTEYDYLTNDYEFTYGPPKEKNLKFTNFLKADETIDLEKVGMLPIKIVDVESGTTLGYLPSEEWITAKHGPTGDYRNVVDEKYDKEGNLVYTDNVETQRKLNLQLRTKIATAYNLGRKAGLDGQVSSRSVGIPLRTDPAPASTLLPSPDIKLAIVTKDTIKTERGITETNAAPLPYKINNMVGALLPAPNGKVVFEPLWSNEVGKAGADTVIRAIEIYLTIDGDTQVSEKVLAQAKAHHKAILETTGFDISTSDGLTAFIEQYYYQTKGFNDAVVKADPTVLKGTPKKPKFMLSISKSPGEGFNKSYIKAGVSFLNRLAKAELDKNGNLNEDFKDLLLDSELGLASKFRVANFSRPGIKGINSPDSISEVTYQPRTKTFGTKEYPSYNDMIKANTTTTLYGKLQLPDGEYVYFAHPNTQLNYQGIMDQDIMVERKRKPLATEISKPVEPTTAGELTEAQKAHLASLTTNMDDNFGLQSRTITAPVTIENLQEIHNFTPVEHRNGKTPFEVLSEMARLGMDSLPEGYNPFYQCK